MPMDLDYDKLASEVARRLFQQNLAPQPQLFVSDTVTDTDGARDLLRDLWQHPDSDRIVMVQVSISPSASAGVYRTDGPGVQNGVGNFLPAGGGVLYMFSIGEVRNFRMQATGVGNTMPFTGSAFLANNVGGR